MENKPKMITLYVDPLILAALEAIATARNQSRSSLMRDCLYTAVWHASNDELSLKSAPSLPRAVRGSERIRLLDGKLITVSDKGVQQGQDR